jgi:hypothetical protein
MIKRIFTSDSYDQAFSEQAIKTPSFSQEFINKFNGTEAQLFYSKHRVLLLGFINLAGMLVLFIFTMAQLKELHQQIDEGRRRVSKLEDVVKIFKQSLEKTSEQPPFVNGSNLDSQLGAKHEPEPMINDLNIKYWGLIQAGHSMKALIEVDEITNFFSKGQMVEGLWVIKSFDHSQMILESIKGQAMTILLEK